MKTKDKKISKYVRDISKAMLALADEIDEHGFDKENQETMAKIGSTLLVEAKIYSFTN